MHGEAISRGNLSIYMCILLGYLVLAAGSRLPCAWSSEALQVVIKHPRAGARLSGHELSIQVMAKSSSPGLFVTAVLTYPGGAEERVSVTDDGLLDDDRPADGVFTKRLTHLRVPGEYSVRAKAWAGRTESWSRPVTFTFLPDNGVEIPKRRRLDRSWLYLLASWVAAGTVITMAVLWVRSGTAKVLSACETAAKDARRARLLTEGLCDELDKVSQKALSAPEGPAASPKPRSNAERDSELMDLRLTVEGYRREIEAWKEAAMEYMDALQRGIELYGPDDPRSAALRRDADVFARFCSARGLDRISANPGDPLVPGLYQVVGEEKTEGVAPGTIAYCTEWGYRSGTEVHKRAKVVIAS